LQLGDSGGPTFCVPRLIGVLACFLTADSIKAETGLSWNQVKDFAVVSECLPVFLLPTNSTGWSYLTGK